jgi:hypothetical protein
MPSLDLDALRAHLGERRHLPMALAACVDETWQVF